jgi:F0F1-type ATP synthase assembly protein I
MWMYGTAWICDKYHIRGPVMIVNTIIGIIGLCLMVSSILRHVLSLEKHC